MSRSCSTRRACRVGVFETQHEGAAGVPREQVVEQRGPGGADVQRPGGAGRDPAAGRHRVRFSSSSSAATLRASAPVTTCVPRYRHTPREGRSSVPRRKCRRAADDQAAPLERLKTSNVSLGLLGAGWAARRSSRAAARRLLGGGSGASRAASSAPRRAGLRAGSPPTTARARRSGSPPRGRGPRPRCTAVLSAASLTNGAASRPVVDWRAHPSPDRAHADDPIRGDVAGPRAADRPPGRRGSAARRHWHHQGDRAWPGGGAPT